MQRHMFYNLVLNTDEMCEILLDLKILHSKCLLMEMGVGPLALSEVSNADKVVCTTWFPMQHGRVHQGEYGSFSTQCSAGAKLLLHCSCGHQSG